MLAKVLKFMTLRYNTRFYVESDEDENAEVVFLTTFVPGHDYPYANNFMSGWGLVIALRAAFPRAAVELSIRNKQVYIVVRPGETRPD